MKGKVLFEEVFADEELTDVISLIRSEDYEGVTNVKDEISHNSGWYNYCSVTFDYKGKRYSIEYKEHTSDNVSDTYYLIDTFVCLGEASEMEDTVTKGELSKIQLQYEKQIDNLKKQTEVLNILRPLSAKQLEMLAEFFLKSSENTNSLEERIGNFFKELSDMKKQKAW